MFHVCIAHCMPEKIHKMSKCENSCLFVWSTVVLLLASQHKDHHALQRLKIVYQENRHIEVCRCLFVLMYYSLGCCTVTKAWVSW